ncbi:MAG: NAD(P)/FAD-dependent oxidoreductase [Capnocytophaga sp.]|nr:NAD(P)/FAD-dependent oxidoreductase [Capnocytophaga sp.]
MQTKYDVVIIGSGLGGLMSALFLAKEGKKVCVLEKNNQYGGNLQTFVRDKIIFDTGVHYVGSLQEGQILYRYFDYAGIASSLELLPLDPNGYDRICFATDPQTEYPHAQGHHNFVAQLLPYFPKEKKALERYVQTLTTVCDQFPLYRFIPKGIYNTETLSLKINDFIKELTPDTTLQAVLLGSSFLYGGNYPHTPLYVHALTVNSYIESAFRFRRGGSQLTKLLVKELRRLGGELFKHSEVTHFSYNDKHIASAHTQDGKEYVADTFISNIDVKNTIAMAGTARFKRAFCNRIEQLKPIVGAFSLHLVMHPNSFPYLPYNVYWFRDKESLWHANRYNADEFPLSYMLSMNPNENNPHYAESITLLTYMKYEDVAPWGDTFNTKTHVRQRGGQYQSFKDRCTQRLLDLLEQKYPDIRSHIKAHYTSTPLTYRDYIGTEQGNCYGYDKSADSPMSNLIAAHTHIPNLFLTGQTVNMHGLLGVTIGAARTCLSIVGTKSKLYRTLQGEN